MVLVFADKNKIILCVDTSGHLVGKLRVRSKERGERNRSRSYLLRLQETLESNLILSYNGNGNLSHDQNHEYVSHFQPCGFVAQLMLASN